MSNYIYINKKRTKLNLDKFQENILDPFMFLIAMVLVFGIVYAGMLVAYGMGAR